MARQGRLCQVSFPIATVARCVVIVALAAWFIGSNHLAQADEGPTKNPVENSIKIDRPELPFVDAGAKIGWNVTCQGFAQHASSSLVLRYAMHRVSDDRKVLAGQRTIAIDASGNSHRVTIDDVAPLVPGVHEFRFSLASTDPILFPRLRRSQTALAETTEPIVVLGSNVVADVVAQWTTVGELHPASSSWSMGQWMPSGTRLIPLEPHLFSGEKQSVSSIPEQKPEELSKAPETQPLYQERLPVMAIGYPHRITIRYMSVGPIGVELTHSGVVDSSVSIRTDPMPSSNEQDRQRRLHQFVYYPGGDDEIKVFGVEPGGEIESILIEAGPRRMATNPRHTGRLAGRASSRDIALQAGGEWTESMTLDLAGQSTLMSYQAETIAFYRTWIASERLRDYALVMGMNSVVLPMTDVTRLALLAQLMKHREMRFFLRVESSELATEVVANLEQIMQDNQFFAGCIVDERSNQDLTTVQNWLQRGQKRLMAYKQTPTGDQLRIIGDSSVPGIAKVFEAKGFLGGRSHKTSELSRQICQALSLDEPEFLLVTLPLSNGTLSPNLSHLLHTIAAMPLGATSTDVEFGRVDKESVATSSEPTSSEGTPELEPQTAKVRLLVDQNSNYLCLTSHAPWIQELVVELDADVTWERVDGGDWPDESSKPQLVASGKRTRVLLPPASMMMLKSDRQGTNCSVLSWEADVHGGNERIQRIKNQVTSIVERIGILADPNPYPELSNGGFELTGATGVLGWLHAQHPPNCVRVDNQQSMEGSHSILMSTDPKLSTRTWLVSETIKPPVSGRLAVSMACRGQLAEGDLTHRIRVSIEATQEGSPMRRSTIVEVPRNGQWGIRQIVLEVEELDPIRTESLRLTVDSLSGGTVWIDDIRIHDEFPTAKEKADLESQAFLAVQGMQTGNLTPSARLLSNPWAQYLLRFNPNRTVEPLIERVQVEEETPGVAEKIRSWLPRPLRF